MLKILTLNVPLGIKFIPTNLDVLFWNWIDISVLTDMTIYWTMTQVWRCEGFLWWNSPSFHDKTATGWFVLYFSNCRNLSINSMKSLCHPDCFIWTSGISRWLDLLFFVSFVDVVIRVEDLGRMVMLCSLLREVSAPSSPLWWGGGCFHRG